MPFPSTRDIIHVSNSLGLRDTHALFTSYFNPVCVKDVLAAPLLLSLRPTLSH